MQKFVLNNGLTVLVESMPYLRSVSIGAWIKAGNGKLAAAWSEYRKDLGR